MIFIFLMFIEEQHKVTYKVSEPRKWFTLILLANTLLHIRKIYFIAYTCINIHFVSYSGQKVCADIQNDLLLCCFQSRKFNKLILHIHKFTLLTIPNQIFKCPFDYIVRLVKCSFKRANSANPDQTS